MEGGGGGANAPIPHAHSMALCHKIWTKDLLGSRVMKSHAKYNYVTIRAYQCQYHFMSLVMHIGYHISSKGAR